MSSIGHKPCPPYPDRVEVIAKIEQRAQHRRGHHGLRQVRPVRDVGDDIDRKQERHRLPRPPLTAS